MKRSPLKRYTHLRQYTPLRAKKGLNGMSDRAKEELKVWSKVVSERKDKLLEKFGYIPCEYCHQWINSNSELYKAEGHHNNHNRRDNTFENCRILHRVCNQLIEDKNVKDVPSLLVF